MAPKLMNSFSSKKSNYEVLKFKEFNKKLKEYQNFIKKNFDYVGKNFAYEARSIHYDNKKKKKVFMVLHQKMKLKNSKKKVLKLQQYLGLKIKKLIFYKFSYIIY